MQKTQKHEKKEHISLGHRKGHSMTVKPDPRLRLAHLLIGWPFLEPWPLTLSGACDLDWSTGRESSLLPDSPQCSFSSLSLLWLFLSAHSSPVGVGRWGGDGEQKCQQDIKQSASVCALIVQPVWFPSFLCSSPFSLPVIFFIYTSPQSNKFILCKSMSSLLRPYHFFCRYFLTPFSLKWFMTQAWNANNSDWVFEKNMFRRICTWIHCK